MGLGIVAEWAPQCVCCHHPVLECQRVLLLISMPAEAPGKVAEDGPVLQSLQELNGVLEFCRRHVGSEPVDGFLSLCVSNK